MAKRAYVRLGIFPGLFDPVHIGHLLIAEEVRQAMSLEQMIWVPTFVPPHRDAPIASYEHRVAMVRKALRGAEGHVVSTVEKTLSVPSYTVRTLRALEPSTWPGTRPFVLIGADRLADLESWWLPEELFYRARFLAVERPGIEVPQDPEGARVVRVPTPLVSFSSREIRHRVRTHQSIRYWVDPTTERYITSHSLYQDPV